MLLMQLFIIILNIFIVVLFCYVLELLIIHLFRKFSLKLLLMFMFCLIFLIVNYFYILGLTFIHCYTTLYTILKGKLCNIYILKCKWWHIKHFSNLFIRINYHFVICFSGFMPDLLKLCPFNLLLLVVFYLLIKAHFHYFSVSTRHTQINKIITKTFW